MKHYATSLACTLLLTSVQAAQKPNIIYILADDMGIGDVKAYNPDCKFPTPNLDKLAENGMRFTDAHTNSSVCTPTRYGILTGRYAWRTKLKKGVTHGHTPHLINPERETIASLLKKQGYNTACIGKWHLGMDWQDKSGNTVTDKETGENIDPKAPIKNGPNDLGFDYYYGISASLNMNPHAFIDNRQIQGELEFVGSSEGIKSRGLIGAKTGLVAKGFKQDQVLPSFTRKTCEWISEHVNKSPDKPFFVYMPLNSPHSPIVPSSKFAGKSKLSPHGDFCMETDWAVGEVNKTLQTLGITDNTILIFTADNGTSPMAKLDKMQAQGHFSSHIYRGLKGTTWEGGHRVPFLVQWPKSVKAGSTSKQVICTTDLMATAAEINQIKLTDNTGEDSVSFLPALNGKPIPELPGRAVIHHSDSGVFAIRSGKWKLMLDNKGGSRRNNPKDKPVIDNADLLLFDMEKDERATTNLSNKYPEVVEKLKKQLADYVNNGRSTQGAPQSNEASKNPWSQLKPVENFLNKETLTQVNLDKKRSKRSKDSKVN